MIKCSIGIMLCLGSYSVCQGARGVMKKVSAPVHINIIDVAEKNDFYRKELVTGEHSQVVLMSLKPQEDIGTEVHDVDQTLIIVSGSGELISNGLSTALSKGSLIFVPAGAKHNIKNTGASVMKLYTIYAPVEHRPGTLQKTKPNE